MWCYSMKKNCLWMLKIQRQPQVRFLVETGETVSKGVLQSVAGGQTGR